jgi:2-polyprenyl-3-methyl-5-hydroxy-6-metoxy-1,4-benzoquinol methylase
MVIKIEDVRNYWNARPCNIRHSNAEIGSREYFDQVEARKYMVEPHIPAFAEFDKWKGKRVLEIGCGLGTDATNFARAGALYTGIELSQESLNLAKKRFSIFGLSGNFILASGEDFPEEVLDEKFDLVYSFGVIHHTPTPKNIINNVKKVLALDGEFRLMMYSKNSWKNFMIEAGLDQPEAQAGCPIAFTYTKQELIELLDGFDVYEIYKDHIFPYVVEKYIKYEYELQPWFQSMPKDLFRTLETSLGWHMMAKCRLKL